MLNIIIITEIQIKTAVRYHFILTAAAAAAAKSLQPCSTVCHPIDGSPPGSPSPGILQARTLEWVAISFSNAWKWNVKVKSLSRVRLLAATLTAAHQAPPFRGFSRQEYWSGVPLPSPYVSYCYVYPLRTVLLLKCCFLTAFPLFLHFASLTTINYWDLFKGKQA